MFVFLSESIKSIKNFSVLEHKSSLLYHILKRISIHLCLVSKYESLNGHSLLDVVKLFESLMIDGKSGGHAGFRLNLDRYVTECAKHFDLAPDFFHHQYQMVDKLLSLKTKQTSTRPNVIAILNRRFNFSNYLVRVYYVPAAGGGVVTTTTKWFHASIDSRATARDVLTRARAEFDLMPEMPMSSCGYGLFEVGDNDEPLLERLLPLDAVLISTLANWRPFVLVVKANYLGDINYNVQGIFDSCHSNGICQKCLRHETIILMNMIFFVDMLHF